MRLSGLHLLLTYRCTYACRHCFLWGSPDQTGTMTIAQVRDLLDQAAAAGVEMVYFEGGEPTLAYPLVLEGARLARERGLAWGVVTNCHFAESPPDAELWFAPFKRLGIADLALSSYAYLLEGEPEYLLRNAVTAARNLGLPLGVLEVGAPADLADLVPCGDPSEVMHKGRAATELADEALAAGRGRRPDELTECPYEDFAQPDRAHVGSDGELQLCQGISAGNVWGGGRGGGKAAARRAALPTRLATLLAGYDPQRLPVVADLLRGGPYELARAHGITPPRALYADACHLCFETRLELRRRGLYSAVLTPPQAYGVVE